MLEIPSYLNFNQYITIHVQANWSVQLQLLSLSAVRTNVIQAQQKQSNSAEQ